MSSSQETPEAITVENPELSEREPTINSNETDKEESIVVFGATGLVGSRIVKALSRTVKQNQTIYIFSRDIYMHDRPQVVAKYLEAGSWIEELKKIPNITTVYCALGATRPHRFLNFNSFQNFYEVNHNLFYQIAVASKDIGVPTFVMISGFSAGYVLPKLVQRKSIIRAATERDIRNLEFDHLIIMRPGPLAGIREKRASLKMFSLWSCLEGTIYLASSPVMFFSPATPFLTANFGTSVGKAAVSFASKKDSADAVTIVNHFGIVQGAYEFNSGIFDIVRDKISEMSKISIPENATDDEVEQIFNDFGKDIQYLIKVILGEKFSVKNESLVDDW